MHFYDSHYMGLKVNLSEPKEKKLLKRREILKKNKNVEGLKEKVIFPPTALIGCIVFFSCH